MRRLAVAVLVLGCSGAQVVPQPASTPDAPSEVEASEPDPDGDLDHDRIRNADDLCPDQPEDYDGFEDKDGCPDPDNDKDGVPDDKDLCPNIPDIFSRSPESSNGCPGGEATLPASNAPVSLPQPPPDLARRFAAELAKAPDLDYPGLERALGLKAAPPARLSFDVRKAKYYRQVTRALKMTPAELRLLAGTGVVSIDQQQRYTMASAYHSIYASDLPVLVTTDSILHALHRSYDHALASLERGPFSKTIDEMLAGVAREIRQMEVDGGIPAAARTALEDVDLYVTVARNLMAGAAAQSDEPAPKPALPVPPRLVTVQSVQYLLDKIRGLKMETDQSTRLRGQERLVDYSQFQPRGHYATSVQLRRYFRTMMWLGRPDLGFALPPTAPNQRDLQAAAAFVLLLNSAGQTGPLATMSRSIDFLVGSADDFSVDDFEAGLASAQLGKLGELGDGSKLAAFATALAAVAGRRGQMGGGPQVFQVFGQRLGLDSFVLSQVVYDRILFHGAAQDRMMPSALDVAAALGNDEAVSLLRPELERYHYASNLLAARRVVEGTDEKDWNASAYGMWLDALRLLDDVPAGQHFPRAMRTPAWRRKQLQAQLGSWTELRHDTVLYLKQSYVTLTCGYPTGYVEPYPAFYARVGAVTRGLSRHLEKIDGGFAGFFANFAARMADLERLAGKELKAQPFTAEEAMFLKKTINRRAYGSGGQVAYDGWYAGLYADRKPETWSPVVTDVHTDPNSGDVLQEGVGDANLLVVAIDNQNDRAIYVGPAYSYYEFRSPNGGRLTDGAWQQRISEKKLPARPAWTETFQAPPVERTLDLPTVAPRP